MTKEEFRYATFQKGDKVVDKHGYCGVVTSVDFQFGIIHFKDDKKGSEYGRQIEDIACKIR